MYNKIAVLQIDNYATLLEKAITTDGRSEALVKYNKEQKGKKNEGTKRVEGSISGSGSSNNKRKWNNNNNKGRENEAKRKVEVCRKCGKNHIGACLKGRNVCYNCGQEGHIALNYTSPKKIECFICGTLDHQVRNYPKKPMKIERGSKSTITKPLIARPTTPG